MTLPVMKDINDEGEGISLYSPIKRDGSVVENAIYLFIDVNEGSLESILIN